MEKIMGYQINKELTFVYTYDFSRDGGAVSNINLTALGASLEAGLVITDLQVFVTEAFDDAEDTATVTCGNEDDRDGYLADFMTLAETDNASVRAGELAGDLLWDNTNDHLESYRIPDAGAAVPSITIGTEALTQGKATFIFKAYRYE